MKKYSIGVDVGGTNIKLGLVSQSGVIVERRNLETANYARSNKVLIEALVKTIEDLIVSKKIKKNQLNGIGFGLPGLIESDKGLVKFLPNIPGWRNVQLKKIIEKAIGVKTFVDNDVNLIALGEWKYGAGKGYKNLMCVTLGTGVGAGLILNGELYRGENFVAGELGHMPLNEKGPECNCGGFACLECYVGNKQLLAKAAKLFKNKNIKLHDVHILTKKENRTAENFWIETGTHIGNGLVGVINLLNPQAVIIGGGVANNYKHMGKTIQTIIKSRCMKVQANAVKVMKAKLMDDAGIIGAHVLIEGSKIG